MTDWETLNQAYEYQDDQQRCLEIAQGYLDGTISEEVARERIDELSINSLYYFILCIND